MDHIPHAESVTNATKILQAISEIGEFERIQNLLKKDFDGTMLVLEKGISAKTAENILLGGPEDPERLMAAIKIVRNNIDTLLQRPGEKQILLKEVEQKLLQAINTKKVSETSMLLTSEYLHIFCDVYAPRKMQDWEKVTDDPHDVYLEQLYGIKYYTPGNHPEKEVTQREKRMLERCVWIIKSYLENLEILIYHLDISPTLREQWIADEKKRLVIAKNICDTVRKIIESSVSFQPYHDLCYPNNPFNGASDIIIQWEQLSKEIREFQK